MFWFWNQKIRALKKCIILFSFILFSCFSDFKNKKEEIDIYVKDLNNNSSTLISSITEGSILNKKETAVIGGFEFYEYFKSDKKELFKLEYIENTDKIYLENYYFKKNKLILVELVENFKKDSIPKLVYLNKIEVISTNINNQQTIENLLYRGDFFLKNFLKLPYKPH